MSATCTGWVLDLAPVHETAELCVLLAMADHANNQGLGIFPSTRTLASKSRCSESTVRRIIAKLEEGGLILRFSPYRQGRGHHNEYMLVMGRDLGQCTDLFYRYLLERLKDTADAERWLAEKGCHEEKGCQCDTLSGQEKGCHGETVDNALTRGDENKGCQKGSTLGDAKPRTTFGRTKGESSQCDPQPVDEELANDDLEFEKGQAHWGRDPDEADRVKSMLRERREKSGLRPKSEEIQVSESQPAKNEGMAGQEQSTAEALAAEVREPEAEQVGGGS